MKDHYFKTLLGRYLKINEAFKTLYKFECKEIEEVNRPAVWFLGHE